MELNAEETWKAALGAGCAAGGRGSFRSRCLPFTRLHETRGPQTAAQVEMGGTLPLTPRGLLLWKCLLASLRP